MSLHQVLSGCIYQGQISTAKYGDLILLPLPYPVIAERTNLIAERTNLIAERTNLIAERTNLIAERTKFLWVSITLHLTMYVQSAIIRV